MRLALFALAGLAACIVHAAPPLAPRAAFDLSCTEQNVVVQTIGDNTMGARGCGRRATYIYDHQRSAWVLNSPVTEDALPPAYATPSASGGPQ